MADTTKKTKLTAASLRDMKPADRTKLLTEKQSDLFDAKRSLAARELANPRKVTTLKRDIALILTIENEGRDNQPTEENA